MSDGNPVTDLLDEPASVVEPPSPQSQDPLARYDAAMAPFLAQNSGIGIVSEHQLLSALAAVRNALSAALSDPLPPPAGESLDVLGDQQRAARDAQTGGTPDDTPPSDEPPTPPPEAVEIGSPPPSPEPAQPPEDAFAGVAPPTPLPASES